MGNRFNRISRIEKGFCELALTRERHGEWNDALLTVSALAEKVGSNLPKQSVSQIINQHGLYEKL